MSVSETLRNQFPAHDLLSGPSSVTLRCLVARMVFLANGCSTMESVIVAATVLAPYVYDLSDPL